LAPLSHLRAAAGLCFDTTRKERASMSILTVRAKVKEEHVADAEAAVKRMFAAIEREGIEGIRYASIKLDDGVTYLALLELEDGVENPLLALPEARDFYDSLPGWYAEPPEVGPATVVGSYRLFSDLASRAA